MHKDSMKRHAEVAAKLINNGNETCISCRESKVYDGGGAFHWKTNYYLYCCTEHEIDIYEFCKIMGISVNDAPLLDYGLRKTHPELELKWLGDTVFIKHKKAALTKEQKDFGHKFCCDEEWGFHKSQIKAMGEAVRDIGLQSTDIKDIVCNLRKSKVRVPDGITEKEVLRKYIAYLFEDVNYADESVLTDNGRYIGIFRLWGIKW